jgi:nitrous oxide reductase accessory protein NosL
MYKKILTAMLLVSSILFASNLAANDTYKMNFDKETTCLVRNLKVYEAPQWASKIELNSGKELFFCSPKSMFDFYFNPGKWFELNIKSEKDFKKIIVTDYATLKPINAKDAFYVYGSKIISPAGDDLVAFKIKKEAEKFAKEQNGKRVLTFDKISDPLIRLLDGRI